MSTPNYWISLFTIDTWGEFRSRPVRAVGFPEHRLGNARKIKLDDLLLFYLTGFSRFVGFGYADSPAFVSHERSAGTGHVFPVLIKVRDVVEFAPEFGLPIHDILSQLSVSKSNSPNGWRFRVRISPTLWPISDGSLVLEKLIHEQSSPRMRPLEKYRRLIVQRPNPFFR